jgi:hypothetical protein
MTDTEEMRRVLQAGTRLAGDVRPRPGAAALVRVRARRRQARRLTVVAAAGVGIAVAAVVVGLSGSQNPHTVVASPRPTASSPSSSAVSTPAVSVPPGPRTLSAALEIHPVRHDYLTLGCSSPPAGTVPAAEGGSCYRLGPAALTIHRVRDLSAALPTNPGGDTSDGTDFLFTLTPADSAAWNSLTASSIGKQLAFVVAGTVYSAPTIQTRFRGGQFGIQLGPEAARQLLAELGG